MRTRHELLDCSDFFGQNYVCACGWWRLTGGWHADLDQRAQFDEHVACWNAAEADLDEVER